MSGGRGRGTDGAEAARRRLEMLMRELSAERGTSEEPHEAQDDDDLIGRHREQQPLPRSERLAAGLHDRLPPRWQSLWPRGIAAQHVVAVVAVLGVALCLTAWWVLDGRPHRIDPVRSPVAVSAVPEAVDGADAPVPSEPTEPAGDVVVDVAGKVRKPGIVSLPEGSRVVDAIEAAGGARRSADLSLLNRARVLVDGEQIVVGLPPVETAGASPSATGTAGAPGAAQVNLNTATLADLDTLPGVGPVTGQAILDWRADHGRFSSVDELLEVKGIGDATLAELRDLVVL